MIASATTDVLGGTSMVILGPTSGHPLDNTVTSALGARSRHGDSQTSAIPVPLGKAGVGKLNFRFRRSICQSRLMLDQRLIAFARHSLQRVAVQYFNDASRVGDDALILYLAGHFCHRCPSHSQHIGKQFLR